MGEIVVFGGTFRPPHKCHTKVVKWLKDRHYHVIVVPSAGHEFKPESRSTYEERKVMASIAFGKDMHAIEDCIDSRDERRALLVMREVVRRWPGRTINFAIGPDIDPCAWSGYDEIIAEGFGFVRVPEFEGCRSTNIREKLERGEDCSDCLSAPMIRYLDTIQSL